MPGKMFTDHLAGLILATGNTHYRPSNGSEGIDFQSLWCDQCTRDNVGQCKILTASIGHGINDPKYPVEWTYDADGQPYCTAFNQITRLTGRRK
jgi:hypothetical protein